MRQATAAGGNRPVAAGAEAEGAAELAAASTEALRRGEALEPAHASGPPFHRWEFERGDQRLEVDVPGPLVVNQAQVGLAAAKGGAGLMYVPEPVVARLVRDGALRIVLEEWASFGPGFHLYHSSRRQVPAGLKLFVDVVRELRPLGL